MSNLVHPRKQTNRAQFYPHTVSIGKLSGSATSHDERNYKFSALENHGDLACAYGPKESAALDGWQIDGSSGEMILLAAQYPEIKRKMQAVLTAFGAQSTFKIADVLHVEGQTLLVVNPL